MNLIYAEIVSLEGDGQMNMARVRIGGVIKVVSIGLLTGVRIGDRVLLCDGVAIARVDKQKSEYVSGDSR